MSKPWSLCFGPYFGECGEKLSIELRPVAPFVAAELITADEEVAHVSCYVDGKKMKLTKTGARRFRVEKNFAQSVVMLDLKFKKKGRFSASIEGPLR